MVNKKMIDLSGIQDSIANSAEAIANMPEIVDPKIELLSGLNKKADERLALLIEQNEELKKVNKALNNEISRVSKESKRNKIKFWISLIVAGLALVTSILQLII